MARQLRALLWKNFCFVKRHPIKTALFYIIPLIFILLMAAAAFLIKFDNKPDCDYEKLYLPPSHPALILSSIVCSMAFSDEKCTNLRANYSGPDSVFQSLGMEMFESNTSFLCPSIPIEKLYQTLSTINRSTCANRSDSVKYENLNLVDLMFRGRILYFPDGNKEAAIMEKAYTNLDPIAGLKAAVKIPAVQAIEAANESVAASLTELYAATGCYQELKTRTEGFATEDDAVNRAREMRIETEAVWGIVEFQEIGDHTKYRIVTHNGLRDTTSTLYLQALLETAIIEYTGNTDVTSQLSQKALPRRCMKDPAAYVPSFSSALFVIGLGYIMVCYTLSSEMCHEKSVGLLEFLYIAGVPKWKIKLSWFIFGSVFFVTIALMCALFFKFLQPKLLANTSFILIFLIWLLYALALLCMCFLCSSLMSTAQRAGMLIFTSMLTAYFLPQWSRILPNVGYTGGTNIFVKIMSFFHSTVAAEIAFAYVFAWEKINKPADTVKSPDEDDEFGGILECLLYLIIQCPMYLLLSWYFDHTAPSKYGIKWPAWFCCMPSYWGCSKSKEKHNNPSKQPKKADIEMLDPSQNKQVGINIDGLTKSYGKDKLAVDQLSVQFYKNEITALLGHNGAGKSTTMNMLTGMISPTEGKAVVDGRNIWLEMKEVRTKLGFCPQYDIIYPELSVQDHMLFYGQLKGIPIDEVELFYMDIFRQMKMLEALKTPAASLSGGMKRKLSIAISLMGNPTTVILDEPTSAIDPFSRRAIWDVVLNYRNKATVVISTHYMQEADVLGDRIAIIDKGSLKCFGTPMYLKAHYGSGLKLSVAHQAKIDYNTLKEELQEKIPLELKGSSQSETTFEIPIEPARTEKMTEMLEHLEENMERHNIVSFGIAESTLEQVFFKVAEGGGTEEPNADGKFATQENSSKAYNNVVGCGLLILQLFGTWIKRFHLSRKSIIGFVFQILAPLVFVVILLLMTKTIASSGLSGDKKVMHPWTTSFDMRIFYSGPSGTFADYLLNPGMGTRCMSPGGIEALTCDSTSPDMPAGTNDGNGADCSCDRCPVGAAGADSFEVLLRSRDKLHNLVGRNITNYLIKTSDTGYIGGIEVDTLTGSSVLSSNFYTDFASSSNLTVDANWTKLDTIFSQSTSLKSHVIWSGIDFPEDRGPTKYEREMKSMRSSFFNAYSNVLLRSVKGSDPEKYGITLSTEEMSLDGGVSFTDTVSGFILGFFCALALMMPIFTVLLVVVTENASGNKRIQYLMGLNKIIYWFANFFWDLLLFVISLGLMVGFMAIFKDDFDIDLGLVFFTGLMYGVSMILFAYVLSFVFKTARTAILLIGLTAPFFGIAAIVLLSFSDEAWYDVLSTLLNFIPSYFVADSLTLVSINEKTPAMKREPIFSWDLLGKRYVVNAFWSCLMLIALICFEAGLFRSCRRCCCEPPPPQGIGVEIPEADPDVEKEKQRILMLADAKRRISKGSFRRRSSVGGQDTMTVEALTKIYGNRKIAVKGVSFGVHKGECFGLLGVNGAGKTTLFKMLTGFHVPTRGDAKILGNSIFRSPGKVAKHMSYCPQEDVIFESLTPGEHLNLYARIRGIPNGYRGDTVDELITTVGLTPHIKKRSAALSGGNKRKLNFAIAALDFPDVIFLDEMTTGMDPKARRAAWTCLETAIKRGSAAVITSHSMEECEALCNRIVIMVNGSFKCIGGVQYLKDKYGNNYNVKFRLGPGSKDEELEKLLLDTYPQGKLMEKHLGYLEIEIPADGLKLSELFRLIHESKQEYDIEDFSASQTTLEHVFVNMVREQE